MIRLIIAMLFFPCLLFSQGIEGRKVWEPLQYFIGEWEGTGKGQSGISKVERKYQSVLGGRFIQVENRSIYEPQEKNPEGEVHEDLGIFSFDENRGKFVVRQFHLEGFVNQYVLNSLSADGKTMIFVTESIENIPPGFRAREIYKILSDDEFIETFELAAAGKDFGCYIENRLRRKK